MLRTFCALFASLAAVLCSSAASAQPRSAETYATSSPRTLIRNVNVVTLDQRGVLQGVSVVTNRGRIEAILQHGAREPANVTVIDGQGNYLIPGLIDAHMHFQNPNELAGYLRYGVTTVFSLGTPDPMLTSLLETRRRIASGELIGAHLYATGPIIPQNRALTVDQVEPFLDEMQRDGLEYIKVYNEIPQPVFDALVAGAHRRGMGVFGHMPRRFPPEYTITHGLNVLAHMEELFFTTFQGPRDAQLPDLTPDWTPDYSKVDPILDLIAANHVAIVPNLVASFNFQSLWADEGRMLATPDFQNLEPDVAAEWPGQNYSHRNLIEKRMLREQLKYPLLRLLTYRAQQKGILLLAGTDAPIPAMYPGRSLHEELRLLAAAGLTNEQALRAATINGGEAARRFVDHNACIGVIQVRCEADLVLVRGNPLDDIRHTQEIVGVMTDGRYYTRETLDRLAEPRCNHEPCRP